MKLTAELVALVERKEPDPGPEPGTTEHTDAEFARMAEAILTLHDPEHLWVFAYGSLIWNPEFHPVEQCRAVAAGWHRSFCLKLTRWRGTRDLPFTSPRG
ncbi:MAG: gamma-glutamylcyclotransferase [Rhizobiaceae bacterium]